MMPPFTKIWTVMLVMIIGLVSDAGVAQSEIGDSPTPSPQIKRTSNDPSQSPPSPPATVIPPYTEDRTIQTINDQPPHKPEPLPPLAEEALTSLSPQKKTNKISLAVTVAGGVSLGAYQAGYLYYLTEVAKLNRDSFDVKLVTGASAGMINSMLTLMAMGTDAGTPPDKSLFYRVWTEMRYNELLDVDHAPPKALSSRAVLERLADKVELEWNKGLRNDLDMVLGASATRLKNRKVEINEGFRVPKQGEKFVFRVQGRGLGREPLVTNYVDQSFGLEQPLLPFGDPDQPNQHNFAAIRQILFASSAIPIVFSPQEIDYCMTSPEDGADDEFYSALRTCPTPKHKEMFVDGGLIDTRPLGLAHRIASSGLIKSQNNTVTWRESPDMTRRTSTIDNLFFLYVDPHMPSYPKALNSEDPLEPGGKLFRAAGQLFKGLFSSAQGTELYALINEQPELKKRMQLVSHDFPTMSGQMLNFFGFFDREFRKFDFYLGMADARRYVENSMVGSLGKIFNDDQLNPVYPENNRHKQSSANVADPWRPFYCLRSVIDGQKRYANACRNNALKDFRILLQVTLDRLYDQCRRFKPDETLGNIHCKRAMAQKSPPQIWKVHEEHEEVWRRLDDDGEYAFEHNMRLLETYNFHFKDLGLDRDDGAFAMTRIRGELQEYIDTFAKKLRFGEKLALRILGKPAINFFTYSPPEAILYLTIGKGAEFALSAMLGPARWMRFNFAIQLQGLNQLLTKSPNVFVLTPALGLEVEPGPLSNPLIQTRIGIRAGFQFSTEDGFMKDRCDYSWFENDSLRCSSFVSAAFVSISLYERIRLQFGVEWFPRWVPPMNKFDKHLWNGLVSVGWQWISPY